MGPGGIGREQGSRVEQEGAALRGAGGGHSQPFPSEDKNTSLQNQLLILLLGRVQLPNRYSVLSLAEQLFPGIRLSAC